MTSVPSFIPCLCHPHSLFVTCWPLCENSRCRVSLFEWFLILSPHVNNLWERKGTWNDDVVTPRSYSCHRMSICQTFSVWERYSLWISSGFSSQHCSCYCDLLKLRRPWISMSFVICLGFKMSLIVFSCDFRVNGVKDNSYVVQNESFFLIVCTVFRSFLSDFSVLFVVVVWDFILYNLIPRLWFY